MRKQSNTLNFEGQNIYVGIDVHLKSWTVSILSGHLHHKTFVQPPSPEALSSYLHSHFPNGNYLSAYEAGFSGFWAHYKPETICQPMKPVSVASGHIINWLQWEYRI